MTSVAHDLSTYESKRDFARTPEPRGGKRKGKPRFVIQEHHARALHWDFRLERDGVLGSWAVPKGLPLDPDAKHLAVHTEDHPLDYFDFEGEIPAGEYGGGTVIRWDRGTYEVEKWEDGKVEVVLHGERVSGRYVLIHTDGKNWLVRRRDPPPPGWQPMPDVVKPMLATPSPALPGDDRNWAYELKWDGVRLVVFVEGGRVRAQSRNSLDVTGSYPELRDLGETLGSRQVILDGEVVAFDERGRPSFARLQQRMKLTGAAVRAKAASVPVVYVAFDLLYLDGRDTTGLPYTERRALLDELALAGPAWQAPPYFAGDGAAVLAASKEQGFEGVVAKRLRSTYLPGRRSDDWRKVKNVDRQEFVIGGWTKGEGNREGTIGALLLGYYDESGLRFAGKLGTGFTARTLADLKKRLKPLARKESPFVDPLPGPEAKKAVYAGPELVAEVEFTEWTPDGKLRHPSFKGLREDKAANEVVRE